MAQSGVAAERACAGPREFKLCYPLNYGALVHSMLSVKRRPFCMRVRCSTTTDYQCPTRQLLTCSRRIFQRRAPSSNATTTSPPCHQPRPLLDGLFAASNRLPAFTVTVCVDRHCRSWSPRSPLFFLLPHSSLRQRRRKENEWAALSTTTG